VCSYTGGVPDINHFVPLLECPSVVSEVVHCDGQCTSSPSLHADDDAGNAPNTNGAVTVTKEADTICESADPAQNEVVGTTSLTFGTPLPDSKYLSFSKCTSALTDVDSTSVLPSIPPGVKSDRYFLISTTENDAQVQRGEHRIFYDDCGAGANTRGFNSVVVSSNSKELFEKDGLVSA